MDIIPDEEEGRKKRKRNKKTRLKAG